MWIAGQTVRLIWMVVISSVKEIGFMNHVAMKSCSLLVEHNVHELFHFVNYVPSRKNTILQKLFVNRIQEK